MKFNSPLTAGIFAGLLAIYLGTANFLMGSISTTAFIIGSLFFGACTTLFIIYNRKELANTNTRKINFVLYLGVIITTLAIVFLISCINYIGTGRLLGMVIGVLAGVLLCTKDKDKIKGNGLVASIIIGVVLFALLRSITFDVLTMSSDSLEPKVHKGEKILINNLSFGLCVPYLPFHILRWGSPSSGDLVIVVHPKSEIVGSNARLFLREVLNLNENQVLVNIDGWLPREQLMASAKPL